MFKRLMYLLIVTMLLVGCSTAADPSPTETAEAPSYAEDLRGAVFYPPRPISDFSFASTTGENFTLSEHEGELILIYFGYRSCPDFCPTTFAELKRVYQALGEPADKLKILFVTVDPERDTLDLMALYMQAFHEDFIGVREEGEALQQVMDDFGVVAEKQEMGDTAMAYLIDHTASVFLIGPDGRLQAQYLYGTDYRDIVHDVQLILDTI